MVNETNQPESVKVDTATTLGQSIYYVGDAEQIQHHMAPLRSRLDIKIAKPDAVRNNAKPGDLCIFYNEFFDEFRDLCITVKARGCATLYAVDGILEWRSAWEGGSQPEVMRPVLCHKFAAIGHSQKRVLEAWGNVGVCEVVGVPRLDKMVGSRPKTRPTCETFRFLMMTAKWPAFNPNQMLNVRRSLQHCKDWFDEHKSINGTIIEPVWRLTASLPEEIGVNNQMQNTTGGDFHQLLKTVDAVITTPSTAMLEGMLQGVPVALLDYNNCPHLVPAAWRITAPTHLQKTLMEMIEPSTIKMAHQHELLIDSLYCDGSATDRMVRLIEEMLKIAKFADAEKIARAFRSTQILDSNPTSSMGLQPHVAATSYVQAVEVEKLRRNIESTNTELDTTRSNLAEIQTQHALALARIDHLEREVARFEGLPSQRIKKSVGKIGKALKIA